MYFNIVTFIGFTYLLVVSGGFDLWLRKIPVFVSSHVIAFVFHRMFQCLYSLYRYVIKGIKMKRYKTKNLKKITSLTSAVVILPDSGSTRNLSFSPGAETNLYVTVPPISGGSGSSARTCVHKKY